MNVRRFEWDDALVYACRDGHLSRGAMTVALQLSTAITWLPKDGKPSGLYWKNETACKSVGVSRATYFRYRAELANVGFYKEVRGNFIPLLPNKSQSETTESQVETNKSQLDNPCSDSDSVAVHSVVEKRSADASPLILLLEKAGKSTTNVVDCTLPKPETLVSPFNSAEGDAGSKGGEEPRQSQSDLSCRG